MTTTGVVEENELLVDTLKRELAQKTTYKAKLTVLLRHMENGRA
jgi:ADP-ribose pyrophosphatase YjhB (NUDIX family)